jgi:hypothetical protein
MSTGTGERYGIVPRDLEEARSENRLPRRDLVRDSLEVVEVSGDAEVLISGYGPHPRLAARIRSFIAWLEQR